MIVGFSNYHSNYNFSNVKGVIHVGAHHGQEFSDYIKYFGSGLNIHWFEPIKESYDVLLENIGKEPNNFFYNFGLGSEPQKKKIWKDSGNEAQSSSFLKPLGHLEVFPHITFNETEEEIQIVRLDDLRIRNSNVLVLDTQGYEFEVLKGSAETLKFIDHIFCEVNLTELYEGCPGLHTIDSYLRPFGFNLREEWYVKNQWGDCYWSR